MNIVDDEGYLCLSVCFCCCIHVTNCVVSLRKRLYCEMASPLIVIYFYDRLFDNIIFEKKKRKFLFLAIIIVIRYLLNR